MVTPLFLLHLPSHWAIMVETSKIVIMISIITITILTTLKENIKKKNRQRKTELQDSLIPWIKRLLKALERLP